MTIKKQIDANQVNVLLSTGAVTIEGKATVCQNLIMLKKLQGML